MAAIPEGLPIVATIALARGMWRMARQHALIERLSAVETLGATTIILTDKTGTLTENRMTVRRLMVPSGEIKLEVNTSETQLAADTQLFQLLEIAILCNDGALESPGGERYRRSDGAGAFARRVPTIIVLVSYAAAFYLLSQTLHTIPVAVAYAVWSGAGVALITLIAWAMFGQRLDAFALLGIGLIVAGVLVIRILSDASAH